MRAKSAKINERSLETDEMKKDIDDIKSMLSKIADKL